MTRYPTDEEAEEFGRRARERGDGLDACPEYGMGEEAYRARKAWRKGWAEAGPKGRGK
jgi:hypothetical protein